MADRTPVAMYACPDPGAWTTPVEPRVPIVTISNPLPDQIVLPAPAPTYEQIKALIMGLSAQQRRAVRGLLDSLDALENQP